VASQRRVGVFFRRVMDRRGDVLLNIPRTEPADRGQALPSADAYSMLHLMKGVVQDGTGKRALELGRPIAAKTGTTNDFRDVWFMGCTADLCAGTWVGRMTPKPIVAEATGGAVALPIWLAFMKAGHPDVPARDFPIPDDVVMMPSMTGGLAPFQRGHVPQKLLVSGP
jgi:penicillin-binding protein 1A